MIDTKCKGSSYRREFKIGDRVKRLRSDVEGTVTEDIVCNTGLYVVFDGRVTADFLFSGEIVHVSAKRNKIITSNDD